MEEAIKDGSESLLSQDRLLLLILTFLDAADVAVELSSGGGGGGGSDVGEIRNAFVHSIDFFLLRPRLLLLLLSLGTGLFRRRHFSLPCFPSSSINLTHKVLLHRAHSHYPHPSTHPSLNFSWSPPTPPTPHLEPMRREPI